MKKYYVIFLLIIFNRLLLSQTEFNLAATKTLKIDSTSYKINYLHFTISYEPILQQSNLTDIYYKINYHEIGTNLEKEWVNMYDGHLINLIGLDSQWKGPFTGLRSVRYKFYLELINDKSSETGKSILINILSTHPDIDAKYYNSFYKSPFVVTAHYYDTQGVKIVLTTYSILSTLRSGYKIIKGIGGPATLILTVVVEFIAGYAFETYSKSLPIEFSIKCNVCDVEYQLTRYNYNDFTFICSTHGCENSAKIMFSK